MIPFKKYRMLNNLQKDTPITTTTRGGNSIGNNRCVITPSINKQFCSNSLQYGTKQQPMPLHSPSRAGYNTGASVILRNYTAVICQFKYGVVDLVILKLWMIEILLLLHLYLFLYQYLVVSVISVVSVVIVITI